MIAWQEAQGEQASFADGAGLIRQGFAPFVRLLMEVDGEGSADGEDGAVDGAGEQGSEDEDGTCSHCGVGVVSIRNVVAPRALVVLANGAIRPFPVFQVTFRFDVFLQQTIVLLLRRLLL